MIPPRLIRSIPALPSADAERWWADACRLHPGWHYLTLQDPIDPSRFPLTAATWPLCGTGAQFAGLVRLEAVYRFGGIYLDSDLEIFRSLEPLRALRFFATWEDDETVPDFVFGAERGSPVVRMLLERAVASVQAGEGTWASGPGVFTASLPDAGVLLLPPKAFAPYHYTEKERAGEDHRHPYTFGAHHWAHSWAPA